MKTSLFHLDYALIQPRHFIAALARLDSEAAEKLCNKRAANPDDDGDEQPYWWGSTDAWNDPMPQPSVIGSTALIPVKGVVTSGLPTIARAFGFCDTAEIAGWVRDALANAEITRIVLDIDSPGGMVTGTPELAYLISTACEIKSVIAHSAGMMDSAAYWIGSQADAVYCTPSADIGCIGVYQVNYDQSAFLAAIGVKATMFKSGDLKGAGHPDIPMSEAQAEHIQSEIDTIGAQFRAAVTSKRTLVSDDSMRGQSFIGTEAADRNLVAGLCELQKLIA